MRSQVDLGVLAVRCSQVDSGVLAIRRSRVDSGVLATTGLNFYIGLCMCSVIWICFCSVLDKTTI